MRRETRAAAQNVLDDLDFFREVFLKNAPTKRDIRQISAHLRKLLADGQLRIVAAPRCGRLNLVLPDNAPLFEANQTDDLLAVGFSNMFTMQVPAINCYTIADLQDPKPHLILLDGIKPTKSLNIEQFLSETVVRLRGLKVSYGDILKFICYHDFGVHFSGKWDERFKAIDEFRHVLSIGLQGEALRIVLGDMASTEKPGLLLDYAQATLLSVAVYLINSPEIIALEAQIRAEV